MDPLPPCSINVEDDEVPDLEVDPPLAPPVRGNMGEPALPTPYPWCAVVNEKFRPFWELHEITGVMVCTGCATSSVKVINVLQKLQELEADLRGQFRQWQMFRGWLRPANERCNSCLLDLLEPLVSRREDKINWLFLCFERQLGRCTTEQLHHYCKENNISKNAIKVQLIFRVCIDIRRQLNPSGPLVQQGMASLLRGRLGLAETENED